MDTTTLAYVTLFAPLAAAGLITAFSRRNKSLATLLAWAGIGVGAVCSVMMAAEVFAAHERPYSRASEFVWLESGGITMKFGVLVDALSVLMSLVVTVVGACIFVFSKGYMKDEDGYPRYFACLSLFAFSMLGIVFSTNLVETFIFWELVGVSSWSLIGFYYAKPSAVEASKKAFLTNRIGDFGMTCGILLIFFTLAKAKVPGADPSFTFTQLAEIYNSGRLPAELAGPLSIGALLVFTGAMAKSAQVPLHVWLPDAMEGPTPVSALMHAATMVAAGVYLIARTFFLFAPYVTPLEIVAWIGGITALLAATMAFVQYDVKKVLAYSTLSQLGYMTMALGLRAPGAAMFHLTTHACFKALLFLCAGSVIYGCHHEQDMRWMGGLRKKMKVTAYTYLAGALALAGIAPLSGFFSKDAILGAASEHATLLYAIGLVVAFMTACYMGRAWFMTFAGEYRGPRPHEAHEPVPAAAPAAEAHGHGDAHGHAHDPHGLGGHSADVHGGGDAHAGHGIAGAHGHGGEPHESPAVMTFPLVVLAILSVFAGLLNIPAGFLGKTTPGFLEHLLLAPGAPSWFPGVPEERFHWSVAILGTAAAVAGGIVAYMFFGSRAWSVDRFVASIRPLHTLVVNKYYIDDAYLWIVRNVQQNVAKACAWIEQNVLKGFLVDGLARVSQWFGRQVRLPLDGHLHSYVTVALVGVLFVTVLVLQVLRGR